MATSNGMVQKFGGLCARAALPCAILVAGLFGYSKLITEPEEKPTPPAAERTLRTRVAELEVVDYPIGIKTHGIVQACNPVTLSAEIAGPVTKVSPSFEVGAYFTQGEVLVEIDPRSYAAAISIAESRLLSAKSALDLARLNEERKLRLIKSNAVAQAEVEEASATREQAEADVDLAAAQLDQAKLDLNRTKIVAPFDGRVRTKSIGLGHMANANSPLGEIFAVDFAEVRLPVSSHLRQFLQLPELAEDPPVEVELQDAIYEASGTKWRAKIVRTEGVLDADSRDLFAIARIEDPFGKESGHPPLRIGQPVSATIEGEVLHDVIALPRNAVRQLDQIVLVNREDQTLLPLSVEAIWSDAEHVVVRTSEIPPGMWLATTPMTYTPEGTRVEIIPDPSPTASVADSAAATPTGTVAQ